MAGLAVITASCITYLNKLNLARQSLETEVKMIYYPGENGEEREENGSVDVHVSIT
jgi:hypothetical protein